MTVWVVVWVVLMMLWLFHGCYYTWEPARPVLLGNTVIPWLAVLILGLVLFGAISPGRF